MLDHAQSSVLWLDDLLASLRLALSGILDQPVAPEEGEEPV